MWILCRDFCSQNPHFTYTKPNHEHIYKAVGKSVRYPRLFDVQTCAAKIFRCGNIPCSKAVHRPRDGQEKCPPARSTIYYIRFEAPMIPASLPRIAHRTGGTNALSPPKHRKLKCSSTGLVRRLPWLQIPPDSSTTSGRKMLT